MSVRAWPLAESVGSSLIALTSTLIVFAVGLVFALRTEQGRNSLAGAAVRVALAALALAERWIGQQEIAFDAVNTSDGTEHELEAAQRWLHTWLERR